MFAIILQTTILKLIIINNTSALKESIN